MRVSSDGSIAVGTISVHIEGTEESYYKPVLWYRNESGEYDMFEDLPYEKLGLTNVLIKECGFLALQVTDLRFMAD